MRCNNCGSEQQKIKHVVKCKKSGMMLLIVQCECGLVFQGSRNRLGEEYFNEMYSGGDTPYFHDIGARVLRQINRVDLIPKKSRVLDFGCGDGLFMYAANTFGHTCIGAEKSPEGRKKAARRGEVYESIPEGEFDVITLWDVIEHLPDPKQTISELSRLLAPGGMFIIETADINSYDYFLKRSRWSFFIMDHYYYYSKKTLSALFDGYEMIDLPRKEAKGSVIKRVITSVLGLSDHAIMIKGFKMCQL